MAEKEVDRPNIRIEIRNTFDQVTSMDVDDVNEKSGEEGEILETNKSLKNSLKENVISNMIVDVFPDTGPGKLEERAKRFALKPNEIKTFTESDLNNLFFSLGINADNADQIRFEAIHMRSLKKIRVEHVVNYFNDFVPVNIECVDEESFNLVWKDKFSAAKALFHTSQPVKGMPVRVASEVNIDFDEGEQQEIGMVNENRIVELHEDKNEIFENCVDISSINIQIPPGYWRMGSKKINSNSVLLRFSMKIDKKPYLVEKCSKYYNSGNRSNLGIFSRNKEILDKNPWGILAQNWDEDSKYREKERVNIKNIVALSTHSTPTESELRSKLTAKRRLAPVTKISTSSSEKKDESEEDDVKKSIKIPRMRMYADEEEEKIKKKKLLQTLKKQSEILEKSEIPNSDLRNMLRVNKKQVKYDESSSMDLGRTLKNRSRNLVFSVSQDRKDIRSRLKNRLDEQHRIPGKSPISPVRFREISPLEALKSEKGSSSRRSDFRHRRRSRSLNRRSKGKMYSEDPDYSITKPRSKVALVIKTQKKPSVASAIQSRKFRTSQSSSSEESDSSRSSSSSGDSDNSSSQDSEDDLRQVKRF